MTSQRHIVCVIFIVINLADISKFSNLVLNFKSFPKIYYLSIQLNGKLWLVLYVLL